ncbi:hypothetical protein GGX14DRAFT_408873 [Mycena pura]|uniref:Uncharacterized protein n=1 Tax=Mycena pura TaxID=153505 RepID=A0AAD6UKA6_9AGAR|nr:hypothetical protein GGX14DRAFT_408873 [Mycena pura]
MLDPTAPNGTLTSVFTFRNSTSLTGIAELNKDVFAVTDNTTRSTVPGSVAIWHVNFTGGVPGVPSVTPLAVLTQALSECAKNMRVDPHLDLKLDAHKYNSSESVTPPGLLMRQAHAFGATELCLGHGK